MRKAAAKAIGSTRDDPLARENAVWVACRIGSALFFRTGDLQLGFYSFKPYFNFTGSPDRIPRLVLVAPSSDQSG